MYHYGTCKPETNERMIDGVLREFLGLCEYPHRSGNSGPIADYLEKRLTELGAAEIKRDAFDNLSAFFPPSPGMEQAPEIILQGHTDMVCAVKAGSGYEPDRDGILAVVDGDTLRSDGRSSLGADCGLGVAVALYLMSRQELSHGAVRLLLTSDEEIGLVGAQKLDDTWLAGAKYLLNTDGFHLGDAVVSSAGGRRESYAKKIRFTNATGKKAYRLRLQGFAGGHSGYDIHKNRANAIKLMSIFLGELREKFPYELALLEGGISHNAIPYRCESVLVLKEEDVTALEHEVFHLTQNLSDLYSVSDPGGFARLEETEMPAQVWTKECRDSVIDLCILIYNGVFATNSRIPELVDASSNLGRIDLRQDGWLEVLVMVRCAVDAREDMIAIQHKRAAAMTGFTVTVKGYKGWPMAPENPLAEKLSAIYEAQTGRPLHITAVHIGLETSVLYQKNPHLQIVSAGTDILNPHSLDEHVPIYKIPPYVKLLWGLLLEIGQEKGS